MVRQFQSFDTGGRRIRTGLGYLVTLHLGHVPAFSKLDALEGENRHLHLKVLIGVGSLRRCQGEAPEGQSQGFVTFG